MLAMETGGHDVDDEDQGSEHYHDTEECRAHSLDGRPNPVVTSQERVSEEESDEDG